MKTGYSYYALTNIMDQMYRSVASVGKRIYADNPRKLAIIVGDSGAATIEKMQSLKLEDFRLFVTRTASEETQKEAGNGLLFTLLQAGLIDQKVFSNHYGRSGVEDISEALRKYQGELEEAQRLQAQDNAEKAQAMLAAEQEAVAEQRDEQFRQEGRQDDQESVGHAREMDKITTRGNMQTDAKVKGIREKAAADRQ